MHIWMENTEGNHYKFYELWAYKYTDNNTGITTKAFVGMKYGKIGTEGRTIFKEFPDVFDARDFLYRKIEQKRYSGYEVVKEQ